MPRTAISLFLAWVCLAGACSAEVKSADISEELAAARKAWQQGDALDMQLRYSLESGSENYSKLLDRQSSAYDTARRSFKAALAKAPRNPYALAEFGRFWLTRREWVQARKLLETALFEAGRPEPDPTDPKDKERPRPLRLAPDEEADMRRILAGLLDRAGEPEIALEYYRKAFELDNSNPRNRLSLAIALCASGMPQRAAPLLKPWVENAPARPADFPDSRPDIQALALYTFALANEETGFLEDALRLYRSARELAERAGRLDSVGVSDKSGMAIARLEDFFDAREERSKQRLKENTRRAERLGQRAQEKPAREEPNLEPLPDERELFSKAQQFCDQAIELKEDALSDAEFRGLLAQARAGSSTVSKELGRHPSFPSFTKAMQTFQFAILKYPRLGRAYFELASCEVMLGRYGSARKLLDEAVLHNPNNLALLNLHGEVLLHLGQWEPAARTFSRLLVLEPESGRANFGLARAYAALQEDLRQSRAGLEALVAAERLGVRDGRMFPTRLLVLKNGDEVDGYVSEEDGKYVVVQPGSSTLAIPKSDVDHVVERQGLHDQLLAQVKRFEEGKQPEKRMVIRGKPRREDATPNFQANTIYDLKN